MKVNIVSVRRHASLTPGRTGKLDTLVNFEVEGEGSDFVVIAADDPDQKAIQAAIAAKLKGRHPAERSSFDVP